MDWLRNHKFMIKPKETQCWVSGRELEGKGKQKEELIGSAGQGMLLFSQGRAVIAFLKGLQALVPPFPRETELLIPSRKSSAHGGSLAAPPLLLGTQLLPAQPCSLTCPAPGALG